MNPPKMDYFKRLCLEVRQYLPFALNFSGYESTIDRYYTMQENDLMTAWELAKELNAWAEYMSDLMHLVEKLYLNAETDKLSIQSLKSIEYSPKNVSAGDRKANTDETVIASRQRRNALLAFHNALEAKIKFLERAHYHCKATYENGKREIGIAERINSQKTA